MVLNLKVNVEDKKADFLLTLLRSLDFVSFVDNETEDISDDLKQTLDVRLAEHESDVHSGMTWEALKASL